jgi:hypothetical protein
MHLAAGGFNRAYALKHPLEPKGAYLRCLNLCAAGGVTKLSDYKWVEMRYIVASRLIHDPRGICHDYE